MKRFPCVAALFLITSLAVGGCKSKGGTELARLTKSTDELAERLDRAIDDRNRAEIGRLTRELTRLHQETEGLIKKIRQGIDTGNEYKDMEPQLGRLQELAARQQTLLGRVRRGR
jgi:hypothetical protein